LPPAALFLKKKGAKTFQARFAQGLKASGGKPFFCTPRSGKKI
jgi:hypothetical protein